MNKIYISYANEDFKKALQVQKILEENTISSTIVNHTSLNTNGDIAETMLNEIKNHEFFLFLFSKYANESNFFSIELNAAIKRNKKVYILALDASSIDDKLNFTINNSIFIEYSSLKTSVNKFIKLINRGHNNE